MTGLTTTPIASTTKVYISPDCAQFSARIEMSAGTRDAGGVKVDGLDYDSGAKVPCLPWRQLNREECTQLVTEKPSDDIGRSISVVKLPLAFNDQTRKAIMRYCSEPLSPSILELLRAICVLDEPVWLGRMRNPANLRTVTIDTSLQKYIGLHVDNWDKFALANRDASPNRICVNIGDSNRYLLFLPVSFIDMVRMLYDMGASFSPSINLTLIARLFMDRFPDVPVVRCCVAPGEAYIAPTENLVHDGSTEDQAKEDQIFTVRGRIRPL